MFVCLWSDKLACIYIKRKIYRPLQSAFTTHVMFSHSHTHLFTAVQSGTALPIQRSSSMHSHIRSILSVQCLAMITGQPTLPPQLLVCLNYVFMLKCVHMLYILICFTRFKNLSYRLQYTVNKINVTVNTVKRT